MSFQAMAWASEQKTGSASRKAVLYAIANHANSDGDCYLRIATIAAEAELGDRATRDAINVLTETGFVKKWRKRRGDGTLGVLHFTLALPAASGSEPAAANADGPAAANAAHEPVLRPRPEPKDLPPQSPPLLDSVTHQRLATFPTPVQIVQTAWKGNSPPLIEHRGAYFQADTTARAIARALTVYPPEAIVDAIRNYATVLAGPEFRWNHRWTLIDFLKRGLDRFVPEALPLENFREHATNGRLSNVEILRRSAERAEVGA